MHSISKYIYNQNKMKNNYSNHILPSIMESNLNGARIANDGGGKDEQFCHDLKASITQSECLSIAGALNQNKNGIYHINPEESNMMDDLELGLDDDDLDMFLSETG